MTCPSVPRTRSHERLRLDLMSAGRAVAAAADDRDAFPAARDQLVRFCSTDLLPHLEADERWLRDADSCPQGRLLAQAMRTEARAMTAAVYELVTATAACEAVAATRVLHTLLAAHAHHEQMLVEATL